MKNFDVGNNATRIMEAFSASARPTLTIDFERYQQYLDGSDLTPEQKEEFLQAAWSIVVAFAELGYRVHPLQEACGKNQESGSLRPSPDSDEVRCEDQDIAKPLEKPAPPGKPEVK